MFVQPLKNSIVSTGYLPSSWPALNTVLAPCFGGCVFPSHIWDMETFPCSQSTGRVNVVCKGVFGCPPNCEWQSSRLMANGVAVFLFYSEGPWLKNKTMESCSNIGDVDIYLQRIPESVQFWRPRCKHWMLHLRIWFPTEQYETNASEKRLLRDLQKYQKDQGFKYLNESTVLFISVGAGEGAHTPDEFAAWKSYFEQWLTVVKLQEMC